jgi:hypothetical protein
VFAKRFKGLSSLVGDRIEELNLDFTDNYSIYDGKSDATCFAP